MLQCQPGQIRAFCLGESELGCRLHAPARGGDSLPIAQFYSFPDLPLNKIALKRTEITYEQLAVQVIGLVRHAPSFQIHYVQLELAAVDVPRAHHQPLRTRDLQVDPRKTQASLVADLLAFFCFDDWIGGATSALSCRAASSRTDAYTRSASRQPHSGGAIHRLEHDSTSWRHLRRTRSTLRPVVKSIAYLTRLDSVPIKHPCFSSDCDAQPLFVQQVGPHLVALKFRLPPGHPCQIQCPSLQTHRPREMMYHQPYTGFS